MGWIDKAFTSHANTNANIQPFAGLGDYIAMKSLTLAESKRVHAHIIITRFEPGSFMWNRIIDMYAKSSSLTDARQMFDKMPERERDGGSWNAIIAGYARHGCGKEALKLFLQMQSRGVKPNDTTLFNAINVCAGMSALEQAKQLHGHIITGGYASNALLACTLIDIYARCATVKDARQVFEQMPERNADTWDTMIARYARLRHCEEALNLFMQMQQASVKPSKFTYANALSACAHLTALEWGMQIHAHIIQTGFQSNVIVGSGLVDMYSKCGSIEEGFQVFDGMPERDVVAWTAMVAGYVKCGRLDDARHVFDKMPERNIVSWNAMVAGYAQSSRGREAIEIFRQMLPVYNNLDHITFGSILSACASVMDLELGRQIHAYVFRTGFESNVFIGNAILDMYCKCGSLEKARQWFFKMVKRDKVSWNAMISGYSQHGQDMKALEMFSQMQLEGMKPTHFTYSSILSACASLEALEYGKQVHACIMNVGLESNVFIGSALVDMYSKCDNVNFARRVFDEMVEQDVVLWNAIIAGCALNGSSEEALELFEHMLQAGKRPDYITFIAVLNGCIKEGLVHAGCRYFESMDRDHYITPRVEHYACMINLLGSTGHMDEVEKFIDNMPFEPNAIMWKSLLNACRIHGNIELAKRAAGCLLELEPENHDTYVMLANVYTFVGRLNEAAEVIKMMNQRT